MSVRASNRGSAPYAFVIALDVNRKANEALGEESRAELARYLEAGVAAASPVAAVGDRIVVPRTAVALDCVTTTAEGSEGVRQVQGGVAKALERAQAQAAAMVQRVTELKQAFVDFEALEDQSRKDQIAWLARKNARDAAALLRDQGGDDGGGDATAAAEADDPPPAPLPPRPDAPPAMPLQLPEFPHAITLLCGFPDCAEDAEAVLRAGGGGGGATIHCVLELSARHGGSSSAAASARASAVASRRASQSSQRQDGAEAAAKAGAGGGVVQRRATMSDVLRMRATGSLPDGVQVGGRTPVGGCACVWEGASVCGCQCFQCG
jgi:hypothetical protein